jgi:cyanophycin synthetase
MRVGDIRALRGPNIYSHRPALSMRLYLDDLAWKESREFPGFNELLLDLLPGLAKHRCCIGREGGFAERLREGAYFSQVVERVALELIELAGVPVYQGKTRGASKQGAYDIIIEYKSEEGTKRLLRMATEIIEPLILQAKGGEPFPLEKKLQEVREFIALRTRPDHKSDHGSRRGTRHTLEARRRREPGPIRLRKTPPPHSGSNDRPNRPRRRGYRFS